MIEIIMAILGSIIAVLILWNIYLEAKMNRIFRKIREEYWRGKKMTLQYQKELTRNE